MADSTGAEENRWIVHICRRADWEAAKQQGEYRDASLEAEGFIHCSLPEQVLATANRFFRGVPEIMLLWIDPSKLQTELRWEPSDGQVFPHIYGPLNLNAIQFASDFPAERDGSFQKLPKPSF